jgi:hypothetical protein
MATIDEVYGQEYRQQSFTSRVGHITDLIASNFANLNFKLRHDYSPLFTREGVAPAELQQIVDKTKALNPSVIVLPIKRDSEELGMLPYLLTVPAEYFRILDIDHQKIYLAYVSIDNMEAY